MKKGIKGTLPLVYDYLNESERKVFELIEKDQTLRTKNNKRKTDTSKHEANKVMVKATLPLIADFLGCDEKRVQELFDLEITIIPKKSIKYTIKDE